MGETPGPVWLAVGLTAASAALLAAAIVAPELDEGEYWVLNRDVQPGQPIDGGMLDRRAAPTRTLPADVLEPGELDQTGPVRVTIALVSGQSIPRTALEPVWPAAPTGSAGRTVVGLTAAAGTPDCVFLPGAGVQVWAPGAVDPTGTGLPVVSARRVSDGVRVDVLVEPDHVGALTGAPAGGWVLTCPADIRPVTVDAPTETEGGS